MIEKVMAILQELGCVPGVYKRGTQWRFHVNRCGNFWADAPTQEEACMLAVESWLAHDRPMDGMADLVVGDD